MSNELRHTPGYVPIQTVVYNFLVEIGDYSDENFFRWMSVAARGFSHMNQTSLKTFKVQYVDIDRNTNSGRLETDFIDWIKVGVPVGDQLLVIGHNDKLIVNDNPVPAPSQEDSDIIYRFIPHWHRGINVSSLYGVSGAEAGITFNIDKERGLIRLSSNSNASVVLVEYVSSGISETGMTFISQSMSEALLEFLHWRKAKADSKATRGQVLDAKQDYIEQLNIIEHYQGAPNYNDLMRVFYGSVTQGIKR